MEPPITDWARGWAVATQAGLADRLPSETLGVEAERLLAADEDKWAKAAAKQRAAVGKRVFGRRHLGRRPARNARRNLADARQGGVRQGGHGEQADGDGDGRDARRGGGAERPAQELPAAPAPRAVAGRRRQHALGASARPPVAPQRYAAGGLRPPALARSNPAPVTAVWHEPQSYPSSWQLDATEGPGRVRVRLRPAPLDIPPRFLKPHAMHKAGESSAPRPRARIAPALESALSAESAHLAPPLAGVLGFGAGLRGGLVTRLQLNETVAYMAPVTYITVASETPGELLLSDR